MAIIGTTTAAGAFLAPYVPSPEAVVDRMLDLARVGPGDTVYDLGAGDGRIVIAAAQRFGARAVGIELDDARFAISSARIRDLGLTTRARIVHGDLLDIDLRPATVVTLYQVPSVNEMLRPALERELRPGARVVTLDFPVHGWDATRVVTGRWPDDSQHAIFLYTMSDVRKESVTMAEQRAYTAGGSSFELQGVSAGTLRSSEGGDASADVVTEKIGVDNVAHKHLAGVKYSDIAVTFSTGMSDDLYDWISGTLQLQQKYMRKNGAVVLFDFDFKQQQRMEFFNALISEVNFPACDAGSKDAAFISLKMRPEYTRMAATTAKGSQKSSSISAGQKAAKMRAANFSLTIGDLDCPGVTAIEAFTVKQRFTESVGEVRDYEFEPGALDVSNLAVTFAENSKNIFQDWFDDFVIKGNNNQSNERNGKLEYLSANLKDVLFTVTFLNLGIFKLERQKFEASSDRIRTVRAEMYCEQITFKPGPDVSAAQSSNLQPFVDSSGSSLTPSGSSGSGAGVSTPVYVVPYVPSVADKLQVPQLPQELAVGAPPRLGRPLKFRS